MPKVKPPEMSDEMWAAVQIIMEDHQISSYKQMTESHQAMVQRMDEMETKWSERDTAGEAGSEGGGETGGAGTQGAGGTGSGGSGVGGSEGEGGGTGEGEGSPPPRVEGGGGDGGDGDAGSGRGGKKRWYERDGYAS